MQARRKMQAGRKMRVQRKMQAGRKMHVQRKVRAWFGMRRRKERGLPRRPEPAPQNPRSSMSCGAAGISMSGSRRRMYSRP